MQLRVGSDSDGLDCLSIWVQKVQGEAGTLHRLGIVDDRTIGANQLLDVDSQLVLRLSPDFVDCGVAGRWNDGRPAAQKSNSHLATDATLFCGAGMVLRLTGSRTTGASQACEVQRILEICRRWCRKRSKSVMEPCATKSNRIDTRAP